MPQIMVRHNIENASSWSDFAKVNSNFQDQLMDRIVRQEFLMLPLKKPSQVSPIKSGMGKSSVVVGVTYYQIYLLD